MTTYCTTNFKTKKALREAVARGDTVTVFQAGLGPSLESATGEVCVSGPHYPKPHTWYAECTIKDGRIVKVR